MTDTLSFRDKPGYFASCSVPSRITVAPAFSSEPGISRTRFNFHFLTPDAAAARHLEIGFSFPAVNIVGVWTPSIGMVRDLKSDWFDGFDCMMSVSAPVVCLYSNSGQNCHTIALSETRQRLSFAYGIREENGRMVIRISLDLPVDVCREDYSLEIWESMAAKPYYQVLDDVRLYWESVPGYAILPVPAAARKPLYSFWYSYHQGVDAENVEAECRQAADMGFETVIVDDGWQTNDNHRGYAYCGDWEPTPEKFPDFPAHIRRVQDMGLKYMIWFSVPFVGVHAKCYEQFKDRFLYFLDWTEAGVLDLRYPEVRQYLIDTYVKAVRDWGVDGLKLDFINEFYMRHDAAPYNSAMDYTDIQDALGRLLSDTIAAVKVYKPEILIEFRQTYIGPEIRRYGNMLRVSDCPGAVLANRVGVIDLRLLSGQTAVHSDMLMWHPEETVENAALQVLSCIFSTIQISVRLKETRPEIRQMLDFWLNFMKKHEVLLQETPLEPAQPQNLYPLVHAANAGQGEELLIAYSENHLLQLAERMEHFYYINAGGAGELLLCGDSDSESRDRAYIIRDCMGEVLSEGILRRGTCQSVWMPEAGLIEVSLSDN